MIICGIYAIRNTINGKMYIGYSVNIKDRWRYHLSFLRSGKHDNSYLQRAWTKYGEDNFEFSILEICSKSRLIQKEKSYIKKYETFAPNGYNLSRGGLGNLGWTPSPDVLEKKSNAVSGEKNPMWGRKHSEKTKELFSKQRIGNKNGVANKNNLGKVKKYKNSSSVYYGVFKEIGKSIRWVARLSVNGKDKRIGTFDKECDAALAFDEKSWQVYRDPTKLNFPNIFRP